MNVMQIFVLLFKIAPTPLRIVAEALLTFLGCEPEIQLLCFQSWVFIILTNTFPSREVNYFFYAHIYADPQHFQFPYTF